METRYFSLSEILEMIDEPNRSCCKRLLNDNKELFNKAKGSKSKHQAWVGGYLDHVTEVCNIGIVIYNNLIKLRHLDFSIKDFLLVAFLHDLEKPWKGIVNLEDSSGIKNNLAIKDFVKSKIIEYGFNLNDTHINALKYAEGEGNDYDTFEMVQLPLAAFLHICDVFSARIWYEFPNNEDSWYKNKKT